MSTQREALRQCLEALRENDQWHQDHDDHNGYPGSDLEAQNVAAITAAEAALAQPAEAAPAVEHAEPVASHSVKAYQMARALADHLAVGTAPQAPQPAAATGFDGSDALGNGDFSLIDLAADNIATLRQEAEALRGQRKVLVDLLRQVRDPLDVMRIDGDPADYEMLLTLSCDITAALSSIDAALTPAQQEPKKP